MSEPLQVRPDQLLAWAASYEEAAQACVAARADHARVVEAAQSWGPMWHEAHLATIDAVNARDTALIEQERRYLATAQQLRASAGEFGSMDSGNRAHLTIV